MSWKKKALIALGAVVLLICGAAAWMLGPALLPAKNIAVGVPLGGKVPLDLALRDREGKPTSLAAQMGPKGMVLFFVRSADWCPFCKAQMVRTNQITSAITGKGLSLAVLSYDKPEILAEFKANNSISYPLLSDTGSNMIDALGLRDPQYEQGSFAYGVPRASTLVIAPDGTVKAKWISEDYRSRISNDEVVAMVDGAGL
ncbi:MAG: peroxiredoxin family protein [Novosphingobium sp.]